jgi:YVTN family beta-propeller protein
MKRAVIITIAVLSLASLSAAEVLMVAHKWADSVGFYDTATGKLIKTIPVGVKPHEFALTPDLKLAYVTNYGVDRYTEDAPGANMISIVDLERREKVGEIDLGTFHRPHGIEMAASGRLYITCDFPPSLIVVDPKTKKVLRNYNITGQSLPHMTAVTQDEKKAYTTNSGTATVTAIWLDRSMPLVHIPVGGVPMGLALTADGSRLYAANRTGDAVVVIDTRTDKVTHKIRITGNPTRLLLTPDGKYLLVSLIEAGDVAVMDTTTLRVVHRFHAGANVEGMTVDKTGQFGYVSAQGDNKVVKFSLNSWKPQLEIKTASRPDPLAVLPGT